MEETNYSLNERLKILAGRKLSFDQMDLALEADSDGIRMISSGFERVDSSKRGETKRLYDGEGNLTMSLYVESNVSGRVVTRIPYSPGSWLDRKNVTQEVSMWDMFRPSVWM